MVAAEPAGATWEFAALADWALWSEVHPHWLKLGLPCHAPAEFGTVVSKLALLLLST